MSTTPRHQERRRNVAFLVFCVCVYLLCAPGRVVFPDDEIVFQTSAALVDHGSLEIEGIPRRTGEPRGRPTGSFGWATGTDGKRYGFFGHGLSVVALPFIVAGDAAADAAPSTWIHAIRSDHFFVHRRGPRADWRRLMVSLTNCVLTPVASLLLMLWAQRLGYAASSTILVGVAYGFGTLAWPYSRTFLSEPLSAVALLGAALCLTIHHQGRETRSPRSSWWLYAAATIVGLSVHIHLLNLIAIPAFIGYAFAPAWSQRSALRGTWIKALSLGAAGLVLLGLSHALRFGSPLESGRFGYYSHFIVPATELLALVLSPGRSLWLTSPILLGAAVGYRRFYARDRWTAWLCFCLVVTRLLFVSTRSDWWGGWALGPRFLVPIIPFALLPIAAAWEGAGRRLRLGMGMGLLVSVALQAHLAQHSIFEWMMTLHGRVPDDPGYLWVSHWTWGGTPAWGFIDQKPDLLVVGARGLAKAGHPGLWRIFIGIGALTVSSLAALIGYSRPHRLRQTSAAGHAPRDELEQA